MFDQDWRLYANNNIVSQMFKIWQESATLQKARV